MEIHSWYLVFAITVLLIFGIIRRFFKESLKRSVNGFKSSYQAQRDFKGGIIVYSQFGILATTLYFLALSFILFKINLFFNIFYFHNHFFTFLIFLFSLIVFTYVKILAYLFFGFIIDGYVITREFIYNWVIIIHILGIVLIPIDIGMAFVHINIFPYFLWSTFIILFFFNLHRIVRGIKIIYNKNFSVFYILLYFCILEIIPIIILWRLLN